MSTAIGLSSVPSARYGPFGLFLHLVAAEVESRGAGRVDGAIDADAGVEAFLAVLETGNGEPWRISATPRATDRSGRGRQGDGAQRADHHEQGDDDRQQALATGEPGPKLRAGTGRQAEPQREPLTRSQAVSAMADRGGWRSRAQRVDPGDDQSGEQHRTSAKRTDRGERRRGAIRSETPGGITGPDRRVLQYGLLGERTVFAEKWRRGVAVRSGRGIELGVSYAREIRRIAGPFRCG